nr:MAG TPA: Terminase small subunit [Caudoviricetes sp.]
MAEFYPDVRNAFANMRPHRQPKYTPEQIADEFQKYIEDLKQHPIELECDYRRQSEQGGRTSQRRIASYPRPPKVLDFVRRWLGMTHQAWYQLPTRKRGREYEMVIEAINQYCADVKFDGAVVGIYNAAIIARDLGLRDNINISKPGDDEDMSLDDVKSEIARLERLQKGE